MHVSRTTTRTYEHVLVGRTRQILGKERSGSPWTPDWIPSLRAKASAASLGYKDAYKVSHEIQSRVNVTRHHMPRHVQTTGRERTDSLCVK